MYEKMSQVFIFASNDNPNQLLEIAWEAKCIHLIPIENEDLQDVYLPQFEKEQLEYKMNKFKELSTFFKSHSTRVSHESIEEVELDDSVELFQTLVDEVDKWKSEMNANDQRREVLNQYESILRQFEGIVPELSPDSLLEVRGIIVRNSTSHVETSLIKYLEEELHNEFELELSRVSEKLVLGSILYPKEYSSTVRDILDTTSISDLPLPSDLKGGTLTEKLNELFSEIKELRKQRMELFDKLQDLYQKYLQLQDYSHLVYVQYLKGKGIEFLKKSENFALLAGYMPSSKIPEIQQLIAEKFGNDIIIQFDEQSREIPTKLINPHGIEEFQIFTEMLPPLKPGTIDPTLLIFMFFPLFYGFIVGDIGYGLIISLLGYFIYKRYQDDTSKAGTKRLGWVIFLSGIVTIAFGFLFGEFFGSLGDYLGLHAIWFHRNHDLMYLLILSIAIGVIHVSLGLLLGVYNGIRVGHTKLVKNNSGLLLIYLGVLIYGLFWYLELFNFATNIISMLFLLLGVVLVVLSEGFIGIIESLSTIGNMLSYARLMALGAASVILADLANELYFTVGGGIFGILVATMLHILNIALALFSPTIHSMRLHLVEFFSKFVEFGSIQFKPYGVIEHFQNY